jgi:hypothetical protein
MQKEMGTRAGQGYEPLTRLITPPSICIFVFYFIIIIIVIIIIELEVAPPNR